MQGSHQPSWINSFLKSLSIELQLNVFLGQKKLIQEPSNFKSLILRVSQQQFVMTFPLNLI